MRVRRLLPAILAFGIPASINLLSIMVFTRQLSLDQYGELSLAWVTIEFTCGILYKWNKMAMMRFFDRSQKATIISIQFLIIVTAVLLLGMGLLRLAGAITGIMNDNRIIYPVIIGIIAKGIAYFIQDVQRIYYEKLTRFTIVSLCCNLAYYLPAILVTILTHGQTSVATVLYIQTLGLTSYILFISARSLWGLRKHLVKKQAIDGYKNFVSYGVPIGLASIAVGMFIRIDRYIIEYTLGFKQLGIYSAAFNLSNLAITSIFSVLTISTYPDIIRHLNASKLQEARAIYRQNGTIILTLIPLSVFMCCLFNNSLCVLFFGAKAAEITNIFPYVLLAVYLFNLRIHYFDQIFQFTKTTRVAMYLSACMGLGHLILSYLLSKHIGLPGIVLSNALMSLAGILFTYVFSFKTFRIELNRVVVGLNSVGFVAIVIYLISHYKI